MTMKRKARIIKITKDDMKVCSSRVIWATLRDEMGKEYRVAWADSPTIAGVTGFWQSRNSFSFKRAWENCKVGDEVWLYHAEDCNFNYFEPF